MDMERKAVKCICCGEDIKQGYNPQGGGMAKIYCSAKCRARQWARDNKERVRASQRKYEAKPENKLRKSIRGRNRKDWLHTTPEYKLFNNAKARAKEKNLEFTIKLSDIKIPEVCPLLGIPLESGKNKCQPNSPSLDRINTQRGYVPNNVWVISHKANTIKSDLTFSELKMFLEKLEVIIVEQKIHEDRKDM